MPQNTIQVFNRHIPSFHFFGLLGFIGGTSLGVFLAFYQQLPLWVLGLMSLVGVLQLFAHTWLQKVITGKEDLVYYRHEIAILILCTGALWLIDQPVLHFLDISLLGVGVFLAFGRWGCYHVGCCHGRPCKVGVRYTEAHALAGFPQYYVGIKIFPIPLVESFFVTITVIIGIWMILQKTTPGTVLIWYTLFYGSVRFVLEFFRGDPERPYLWNFSEAQWTTLMLFIASLFLSYVGLLPYYICHTWVVAIWILGMLAWSVYHKIGNPSLHNLLHPQHIRELAQGLKQLSIQNSTFKPSQKPPILLFKTSLGLVVSEGISDDHSKQKIRHYTLSSHKPSFKMTEKNAQITADLILCLRKHKNSTYTMQSPKQGIYHIVIKTNT
ncbi:MAG: prolipoprotein diacylglyceryl transferase [Microscillaceae bacterium]|nr:prolipoprotein diacylglyceryl transferase [Microscillaceae bacterium]